MAHILFFATKNDLLPILEAAEKTREIKYVRGDRLATPSSDSFLSGTTIPRLGQSSHESAIGGDTFLVCDRSQVIRPRQVSRSRSYIFDQLINPDTITFTPGGLWGDDVLLYGRFATASTSRISLELLKLFRSLIRKRFEKIKSYYVGQEAAQLLDQGKRLTIAAQSPRSIDLRRAVTEEP